MTHNLGVKQELHDAGTAVAKNDADQQQKKNPSVPVFKKRHRGCSFCILDVENAPLPEFPPNEVAVGVITMEDVIEELLQVHQKNENVASQTQIRKENMELLWYLEWDLLSGFGNIKKKKCWCFETYQAIIFLAC